MKTSIAWKGGMKFTAAIDTHEFTMDANPPLGQASGPTPKQLLLAAISGCTGMDVAALLRKHKQAPSALVVEADAELTSGYPAIFREVKLRFIVTGEVDSARLLEAVALSQTKYCGVTAMVANTVPVNYVVFLNGAEIGAGSARFTTE